MKGVISGTGVARLAGCLPLLLTLSAGAVNITFDGALLDRPCQIDSACLNQTVQFLERPVKDFQVSPGKGPAEKFSGDKESAMKEQSECFLKVTGVNAGKLDISILDTGGTPLMKLGEAYNHRQGTPVDQDTLPFNFKAYVQAKPDALAQKSVTSGSYASTVKFELIYE